MIQLSIDLVEEPRLVITTEQIPFPVATVWLVHTEALYLKQWWAPAGYQNTWAETTPEPGGTWRVVQRDPQGNVFSFWGRYEEVEPNRRLVHTRTSELFPDATTVLTLEFSKTENGTQLVTTQEFQTPHDLRGFIGLGGMERIRGASAGLDALLGKMSARDE